MPLLVEILLAPYQQNGCMLLFQQDVRWKIYIDGEIALRVQEHHPHHRVEKRGNDNEPAGLPLVLSFRKAVRTERLKLQRLFLLLSRTPSRVKSIEMSQSYETENIVSVTAATEKYRERSRTK